MAAPLAPVIALVGAARLGFDPRIAAVALGIYAVVAVLILRTAARGLGGAAPEAPAGGERSTGLGPANRVTLLRAAVALPVAGFAVFPAVPDPSARWWIVGLATVVLALDGIDGWVARRTGTESAFGARFDMETDAALLLALSVVAWRVGPAGAWVLGIGLLRYLFVAAAAAEPRLRAPLLHDQLRRKTVCVVQGIALPVAVAPLGMPSLQVGVAAAALGLLIWSFGVDTAWLLRRGTRTT